MEDEKYLTNKLLDSGVWRNEDGNERKVDTKSHSNSAWLTMPALLNALISVYQSLLMELNV